MSAKESSRKKPAGKGMPAGLSQAGDRIMLENVNVPGYATTADGAMYRAMHKALLKVLPSKAPGLTQAEVFESVVAYLPADLFPGGSKAGWWMKTVQLDQEAKGTFLREATTPLRRHRKPGK
jgi:hypothetical protein